MHGKRLYEEAIGIVFAKSGTDACEDRSASFSTIVHIDSAANESLNLQCGENAGEPTIIDTDSAVACGITIQPPGQPLKANASGF